MKRRENEINSFQRAGGKSDKIWHHGYHRFYPLFLTHLRDIENLKMLELGYEDGKSIDLWANYFNKPEIHSIDIISDPHDARVSNYILLDQSNNDQLDQFVQKSAVKYSFIIDDASHVPEFQWNTFIRFINLLEDEGIYIIEDIETNFWGDSAIFGYKFNSDKFSLQKKLLSIFEVVNKEFVSANIKIKYGLTDIELNAICQIETFTIAANSIIIVKKNNKAFNKFYRNHVNYRHKNSINSQKKQPFFIRIKKKINK